MNRLRITLAMVLVCEFSLLQPLMAQNESTIKATIRSDGTLVLEGTARYTDLVFGGADTAFTGDGPVGIRSVTMGQHLYLKDECAQLQKQLDTRHTGGGNLHIRPDGVTIDDHSAQGGWLGWSTELARTLGKNWKADVPGQMQVLLEANPNGDLRVVEQGAFTAGVDRANAFVTTTKSPNWHSQFRSGIEQAVHLVAKSPAVVFPTGSTAKSVILMATFVADHDLQVSIPDLSTFRGLPDEEATLRIARICSILDSAYLYEESDHLRKSFLPSQLQHRFVPEGVHHHFYSKTPESLYIIASSPPRSEHARFVPYINAIFERLATRRELIAAESFAKRLCSQVSNQDTSMSEFLASQLDKLNAHHEATAARKQLKPIEKQQ